MRSLAITVMIFFAMLGGLISQNLAFIGFNWVTFMRPQDLDAWGFWHNRPLFQVSILILIITTIRLKNFKLKCNTFTVLAMIFYIWIIITAFLAVYPQVSLARFNAQLLTLGPSLLLVSFTISSIDHLKYCIISMSSSILLLSSKIGLSYALKGGGRITDNIDGFVGDNNVFGLCICLTLGMIFGLLSITKNKILKIAIIIGILLSILTILFTQSRGAFLTLAVIFVFGIINSKRPLINLIIIAAIVFAGYTILPKSMFSRLQTVNNLEEDSSAMHRFLMWKNAFKYANQHPITGIGIGCFRLYNMIQSPDDPAIVTHSVYFQILSELGYTGLLIYLLLLFWSIYNLHRTYRKARDALPLYPEINWVVQVTYWMRNALIGYVIGSAFLDMVVYDIPWYTMLYGSLFHNFLDNYITELEYNCSFLESTDSEEKQVEEWKTSAHNI